MKRRALVMVAALALAGGACGGGDNDDVTDDATATTDEADDAGDVTDEAPRTSDADDSGDVTVTGVTVDIDAVTADGGTVTDVGLIRDELVRQLVLAGMTDVQATCMADNLDMEEVAANGANDLTMFINLFETCGIDASKLTQPGP